MNEKFIDNQGRMTVIGDAGALGAVIAKVEAENTIPATRDDDGVELTPAVLPDMTTLIAVIDDNDDQPVDPALKITTQQLKSHAFNLPFRKAEKKEAIRTARNLRLAEKDATSMKFANRTTTSLNTAQKAERDDNETVKQTLRDLPVVTDAAVEAMTDTDQLDSYMPDELA